MNPENNRLLGSLGLNIEDSFIADADMSKLWEMMSSSGDKSKKLFDTEDFLKMDKDENVIEKNLHNLNKKVVSRCIALSDKFVEKHIAELDPELLVLNEGVSDRSKKMAQNILEMTNRF